MKNVTPKALCLNMIVKNEMANMERCLGAVAPYIACWVIGDTGSTDGTQDFIRSFFSARGIPGELHSFPFINFSQARNEALDRARASKLRYDYLLLVDADMELVVHRPAFSRNLKSAAYKVLQRYGGMTYWNNRLLRRNVPASYKGVTHEYLDVRAGETKNLEAISFADHATGANRIDKYARDARLLTDAIATERDPGMIARYTFYLANTLRDSGQKAAALKFFLERTRLGHFAQEVFASQRNVAVMMEDLDYPINEVIAAYVEAFTACPTDAEALHGAARFCRNKGLHEQGYQFAAQGLTIAQPKEGLFVADWIYDYGLLDELAINAYWTGRYAECLDACNRLLSDGKLPEQMRPRVQKNQGFAINKLAEATESSEAAIFATLLRSAREKEKSAYSDEEIISAYLEASAACPTRAEALHGVARFCRCRGNYEQGYQFAARGLAIPYPDNATSVEDWIYEYGLLDELAINAYWIERYAECIDACDRLLSEGKLPADHHARVLNNKNFAISGQRELDALASPDVGDFIKLLRAAREKQNLGRNDEEIIAAYQEATAACPTRAEALHAAARYCRTKGLHEQGYRFAAQGLAIAYPTGALAVEEHVYDYGLLDELATSAYWTGRYAESVDACDRLLREGKMPVGMRDRILKNKQFAVCKLEETGTSAPQPPRRSAPSTTAGPKVCLNMIVRNESAMIERCLRSLVDYVDCWVIGDTGSTDGTQDIIRRFFAENGGKPGQLHEFPFVDFEQARNEALDRALASDLAFEYLLFADADMELVVINPAFMKDLTESAYGLLQKSTVSCRNTRVVRRDPTIRYRGVTHEYIEVPQGRTVNLDAAWFIEHADGANRADALARDIRLLKDRLEQEPNNHRYWFYLGQSYRDAGQLRAAVETYAKRVTLGGWEEEAWYAQLQRARLLLQLGDEAGFVREAVAAYNRRPSRAEPLFDLAKHARENSHNEAALMYAEMGLTIRQPLDDVLFVEDYVYEVGLQAEYSIAGFYTQHKARRLRARDYCEWIALTPHRWDDARELARSNCAFYAQTESFLPSVRLTQIKLAVPETFMPGNMSMAMHNGSLYAHVRSVNYFYNNEGWVDTRGNGPVDSRNFLVQLDGDLKIVWSAEIAPPADLPPPAQTRYVGFEDGRIFSWGGDIWSLTTTRHFDADETWRTVLARLKPRADGNWQMTDWRVMPHQQQHEKNWMPVVEADALRFVHSLDPVRVLDASGRLLSETPNSIVAQQFSGGTNLLSFDGGWLCLVHEYTWIDLRRHYSQRFLWLDQDLQPRKLTRRFYFSAEKMVEFAIGLVAHPHRPTLLVSFGKDDTESWIAEVSPVELRRALNPVDQYRLDKATFTASAARVERGVHTFDLFNTLIARRDPQPQAVFHAVEQRGGHPGFAAMRSAAEAEIFGASYTLDDIYTRLKANFGFDEQMAARLMALEVAIEEESIFPIMENIRRLGPNDIVVSDMYHSEHVLRGILQRTCDVVPARLMVSSHGKRSGRVWQELLSSGPIIEHLGDDPVTDEASAKAAGIPVRLTTIANRTAGESELADHGFAPLANLVREARLSTWSDDSGVRTAQLAQIEVNFPLIFLANLYLLRRAREVGWDNILFSARDCFLWSRLYDDMRRRLTGVPTAAYFYTGRVVRACPSDDYLDYFTQSRTGRRNVVVDLCGTGWSLSQLVKRSPKPMTDILLLHQIDLPDLIQRYSEHSGLSGSIVVDAVVRRAPNGGDNDALEDLNRAPHAAVQDMRREGDFFMPVFSTLHYDATAAALVRTHHTAFDACSHLLEGISADAIMAMGQRVTAGVITRAYARMSHGMLDHLDPLSRHKGREERLVWDGIRESNKISSDAVSYCTS